MSDRELWIQECAQYLINLGEQSELIYSDTETDSAIGSLEATKRHLQRALNESEKLWSDSVNKRRSRTGLRPTTPSAIDSSIVRALAIAEQGIDDLKRYRTSAKPDRYRIQRAAVNLAAGYFANPTAKPVLEMAVEMLDAAEKNSSMSERTVDNWLADFKARNLTS